MLLGNRFVLQPKCTYQIRLKSEVNPHIENSAPEFHELVVSH